MSKKSGLDKRVLVGVGVVCAGAAWWIFSGEQEVPDAPPVSVEEVAAVEPEVTNSPIPRPKRRVMRSAPVSEPVEAPEEAADAPEEPEQGSVDTGVFEVPEPTVRVAPDDPAFKTAIDDTVREQLPGIKACLEEWLNTGMEVDGRVRMGFKLNQQGLGDVWIVKRDDIPLGVTSCLSGAIWQANWPAVTEGEITIHYPFALSGGGDDAEE